MISIPGYRFIKKLDDTPYSTVYRAIDIERSIPVSIKILNSRYSSPKNIETFQHEYNILKDLSIPGILTQHSLVETNNGRAIIREDFKGVSLRSYIDRGEIQTEDALKIFINIAETVGEIHQRGIINRSLAPENIIIDLQSKNIKIINFENASLVDRETQSFTEPGKLKGNLLYISPEQTGRMNRSIDYRSDYYSLGIILYEMLTGKTPFFSIDKMELIHSHIAGQASPPAEHDPRIPLPLSQIAMKLISKTAENRYQSITGLISDLKRCQNNLKVKNSIDPFPIGENDLPDFFSIPEKIYGRDKTIEFLRSLYQRAVRGEALLHMITGPPGIGKSALIKELVKMQEKESAYFISGKSDQYMRSHPHYLFLQAFQELVKQVLTESEERLNALKNDIINRIGENGGILTDVIPDLELIIGPQPEADELPPLESQNRFNHLLLQFIKAFTNRGSSLVIFMDDLQWADNASLGLIEVVLTDNDPGNILLIGAYRDNEVDETHPLIYHVRKLEERGIHWDTMKLSPLEVTCIEQMISDTLLRKSNDVNELAQLVYQKTGGNPFFVKEFLVNLYREDLIRYTSNSKSGKGTGWEFNINNIQQAKITDNVADLITKKIKRIPGDLLSVLKIASCLNIEFDLEMLSLICKMPSYRVFNLMKNAINEGLIIKFENSFLFAHDRVREAVYGLIFRDELVSLHYRIGKYLVSNIDFNQQEDRIFEIVHQFNLGAELITGEKEKLNHARMNITAGKRAKASNAYVESINFFIFAKSLLSEKVWEQDYELALSLYTELGEAYSLTSNLEEANVYFDVVLQNTKSPLDKIRVYEAKVTSYQTLFKSAEAIEIGREALGVLGIKIPRRISSLTILLELIKVKCNKRKKNIMELIDLPEITDAYQLAIIRILTVTIPASYLVSPDHLQVFVLKFINMTLKYGNSKYTSFAYLTYAMFLCGGIGKIEEGYQFGKLGLRAFEKYHNILIKAKISLVFGGLVIHWKDDTRKGLSYLYDGFREGLEIGDLSFASYCLNFHCYNLLFLGEPLEKLMIKLNSHYNNMKKTNQASSILAYELLFQMVIILSKSESKQLKINGEIFNENNISDETDNSTKGWYSVLKILLLYLSQDYTGAIDAAEKGKSHLKGILGMFQVPQYYFYYSLTLLAMCGNMNSPARNRYLKQVKKNLKKIRRWAHHAPVNFKHQYLLIKAEIAGLEGNIKKALLCYDNSIKYAKKSKILQDAAIANELAGRFCLTNNMRSISFMYLTEAYSLYNRWGCLYKVNDLEEEYNHLSASRHVSNSTSHSQDDLISEKFDLNTVIKATRVISGEIVLEQLLGKLMNLLIENAGAMAGYLILEKNDLPVIEAEVNKDSDRVNILKSIPAGESGKVSMSIINYVKRTGETVVLNDAANEGIFINDNYIKKNRPGSILCIPLLKQKIPLGLIYLENSLTTDAFPPERLDIVKILAAQAAISLENANLYNTMEETVVRRTGELEEANEKLKELDRVKTNFFTNISHEFRTPLTMILAPIQSVLQGDLSESKIDREFFNNLHKNGVKLLKLINNLLDFSKIEAGKMKAVKKSCEISKLVQFYASSFEPGARRKGIEIEFNDQSGGAVAAIDSDLFEKAVSNVISNAVKFTPEGGKVAISLSTGNENRCILKISDTGIGIPDEMHASIFERFSQVDTTTTRKYDGTGLGLSLAHEIMKLHNGAISVESKINRGSTFTLSLPLCDGNDIKLLQGEEFIRQDNDQCSPENVDARNQSIPSKDQEKSLNNEETKNISGKTLLLVEDNKDMLEFLSGILKDKYHIIKSSNGKKAFDYLASGKLLPDLILADIMMPEMDGYELTGRVRSDPHFKGIPIILLTARAEQQMKVDGLEKGAVDYITKPFNGSELLARIKAQIELKSMRDKLQRSNNQLYKQLKNATGKYISKNLTDDTEKKLDVIIEFLHENYEADLSRHDLANAVDMSPDHLGRSFKLHTGKKINDYINEIRVREAGKRLAETDDDIILIAFNVGFESLRTFNRVFMKLNNITPTEYRKKRKDNQDKSGQNSPV